MQQFSNSPILKSLKRVLRFHMGTIALGSLIIAIIQFIRAMVKYIEEVRTQRCATPLLQSCVCGRAAGERTEQRRCVAAAAALVRQASERAEQKQREHTSLASARQPCEPGDSRDRARRPAVGRESSL